MAKSTTDIVFTDLDGTLLNSQSECSSKDYETLVSLKSKNIIRVAATGRSLYSAHKVFVARISYRLFNIFIGGRNYGLAT